MSSLRSSPGSHLRRATTARRIVSVAIVCAGLVAQGCVSPSDTNSRYGRHFESDVWSGSLAQQTSRPDRLWPEAVLLATVPVAFAMDSELNEDRPRAPLNAIDKNAADTFPIALAAGGLAIGGWRWANGDDSRSFEAGAEAIAGTAAVTQIMKTLIGRPRPDSGSHDSFPSGHTAFAFAGATLIARELEDPNDTSWNPAELLLYAPAVFVGVERVRSDRHWTSDVAFGAFLGTFLTNWIWDAHFKRDDDERATIFGSRHRFDWRLCGGFADELPVFGVEFSF